MDSAGKSPVGVGATAGADVERVLRVSETVPAASSIKSIVGAARATSVGLATDLRRLLLAEGTGPTNGLQRSPACSSRRYMGPSMDRRRHRARWPGLAQIQVPLGEAA